MPENDLTADHKIRLECLSLAVEIYSGEGSIALLQNAQLFERFARGTINFVDPEPRAPEKPEKPDNVVELKR